MDNLDNIQQVVSWKTTKTPAGFRAIAYSCGYQVPTVTHFNGVYSSRAKASRAAKKAATYIRHIRDQ